MREVAVKVLDKIQGASKNEVIKFFKGETVTLEKMRDLHHPHLIEAIKVCERGPERLIVFPWATGGNLRDLWNRGAPQGRLERCVWALEQIRGLADGLSKLHATGIRHGDIKPENILVFEGDGNPGLGSLVIADVGFSKFHADGTRQREAAGYTSTNKYATPRYEPPEVEIDKPSVISRRYDSWSLGCVLVEFIIWLLRDKQGQDAFRLERRYSESKLDSFWEHSFNRDRILNTVVKRWIETELTEDLKTSPALRDLIKLVASRLLVASVDSRAYMHEFCESLEDIYQGYSDNLFILSN